MLPDGSIRAEHIWKRFRPDRRPTRLRGFVDYRRTREDNNRAMRGWALRDVNLDLEPGGSLGLIGTNGSGKSTLLKILCQVMYPHSGQVEARGRVGALIEVAAGIHPQLSGRENIYIYGALLGLSRKDTADRFDEIVDFAEIGHAIDRQVKFYSSGMKMRLGFAVAAFLEPDTLLVDEVLAVGDAQFQRRCLTRMREVLNAGTTLLYVSHDLATVEATCTRAMWLERGVVRADGPVREILSDYREAIEQQAAEDLRQEGDIQVAKLTVTSGDGDEPRTGEPLRLRFELEAAKTFEGVMHVGISDGPASPVINARKNVGLTPGMTSVQCEFEDLPVSRGRYYVWVAFVSGRREVLPWSPAAQFDVVGPDLDPVLKGVVRVAPVYAAATWKIE